MKFFRKYMILIAVMVCLSPLGILLPHWLKSGEAWGEWSVRTVKEQTGHEPEGMKAHAKLYHAPFPDYSTEKTRDSMVEESAKYLISGVLGIGIILFLTFGITKMMSKKS